MGYLEIQLLERDGSALETVGIPGTTVDTVHVAGTNVVYLRPDVASSLTDVAALTPLMISLDYLLEVPYDAALGEERFETTLRRDENFDVIELRAGEMYFSALLPRETPWPHVTIHRAGPRRHEFDRHFTPFLERAFLVALRDAVRARLAQS